MSKMYGLVNENMETFQWRNYETEIRLKKLDMFAYLVSEPVPDPENYVLIDCDNFDVYTLDGFMLEVQSELHSMINHLY